MMGRSRVRSGRRIESASADRAVRWCGAQAKARGMAARPRAERRTKRVTPQSLGSAVVWLGFGAGRATLWMRTIFARKHITAVRTRPTRWLSRRKRRSSAHICRRTRICGPLSHRAHTSRLRPAWPRTNYTPAARAAAAAALGSSDFGSTRWHGEADDGRTRAEYCRTRGQEGRRELRWGRRLTRRNARARLFAVLKLKPEDLKLLHRKPLPLPVLVHEPQSVRARPSADRSKR